jgi:hypothetical protein
VGKKPEDRSHLENAEEIKYDIRMGIGEVGYKYVINYYCYK